MSAAASTSINPQIHQPHPRTPRNPRTPSIPSHVLRLGLGGDTMLGRCVGEAILLARDPTDAPLPHDAERSSLAPFFTTRGSSGTDKADNDIRKRKKPVQGEAVVFTPEVVALAQEADLLFLNLECCITNHHQRWNNPHKPFFFRAPFCAVEELKALGVDAVTLANNHALDYDVKGLLDTLDTLDAHDIPYTGAGRNLAEARQSVILRHKGLSIGIIGMTDHPLEFEAKTNRPGVCYIDLQRRSDVHDDAASEANERMMGPLVPSWVKEKIRFLKEVEQCDVVLVSPHWGPNMCVEPLPYIRQAAEELREMGADLIAGHSAHCFQGVSSELHCLFDMGDFVDDYATDTFARNDLGLFWFVLFDLETKKPWRLEAVPLKLDFCQTRLLVPAAGPDTDNADVDYVVDRFKKQCAKLGGGKFGKGGGEGVVWDEARGRLVLDFV